MARARSDIPCPGDGNHGQEHFDQAIYHQRRALSLNPNDDLVVVQQGELLTWLGEAEEGVGWIRKAMRLNPYHPERFWSHLARACFAARRYQDAIDALRCISAPDALQRAGRAGCHAQLGEMDAADEQRQAALAVEPSFRIADLLATLHYKDPAHREHHRESLALAGFPP